MHLSITVSWCYSLSWEHHVSVHGWPLLSQVGKDRVNINALKAADNVELTLNKR